MKHKEFLLVAAIMMGGAISRGESMCVTDKVSLIRSLSDYEGWRSTYQDKDWIVEAIFFDLNGDGFDEVLLTFPNQRDRMGSSWRFLSTSPKWQRPKRHAGDVHLYCHPYNLYELKLRGERERMVGINAGLEIFVSDECVESSNGSFVLGMTREGRLSAQGITNGVGAILSNDNFDRLSRVRPEVYAGYAMLQIERGSITGHSGERSPEPEPPADVGRVLSELGWSKGLVVCFDADNDGDIDCYLAKGEVRASDEEDWTLYLNKDGRLNQATTPVVLNRKRGYAVTALAPKVRARANGFHRVAFNYKTTEDAVVVLAKENGKLVLRGCEACLREFPPESVLSAESLVSDFGFASLERLPCQTCSASGADAKHLDIDPRGAK